MAQPGAEVSMEEQVVLVDAQDNDVGRAPKLSVHLEGRLHRAISVFLLNSSNEMLLQRRASGKYHSPLLWSNACCTHPRPGEAPRDAARRRLVEEMGVDAPLEYAGKFTYRAVLGNELIEHELDHIFLGRTDQTPAPDPEEVAEWRWVALERLEEELARDPAAFTAWFPLALKELRAHLPG